MQSKTITINLRKKLLRLHRNRRRQRISGIVKEEAARLTKSEPGQISISRQLNQALLKDAQGSSSFMLARVTVSVEKKGEGIELRLPTTSEAPQAVAKTPAQAAAPSAPQTKQAKEAKKAQPQASEKAKK